MSLASFDYRGYRCEIFPEKITFSALPDNPIGEKLPRLHIPSSKDDLEIRKKLAKNIIDKYCWNFLGEVNGLKISTRLRSHFSTTQTWFAQVIRCQKKDEEGNIISERKSQISHCYESPIAAINAVLSSTLWSDKDW